MAKTNDEVVFLDADGNEVSNDPRFLARRTLGVDNTNTVDEALAAENAALKAQIQELLAAQSHSEELEDDDESTGDYSDVKGPELAKLAKDRGIAITKEDGSKLKAGEVREALVAQDKAQA